MEAFCTLLKSGPEMMLMFCYVATLQYNAMRGTQIRTETYWRRGVFCSLDDAGRLVRRYRFHEHASYCKQVMIHKKLYQIVYFGFPIRV